MASSSSACVFDIGTSLARLGISGEDSPREVVPSIVALPRRGGGIFAGAFRTGEMVKVDFGNGFSKVGEKMSDGSIYLGEESLSKRQSRDLKRFMEKGVVQDWQLFEKFLLEEAYQKLLKVAPEEQNVLFALKEYGDESKQSLVQREKLCTIAFETLRVPGLSVVPDALLALISSNHSSGIVLDVGSGINVASAIHDGKIISKSVTHCSENSFQALHSLLLKAHDYGDQTTTTNKEIFRDILEKKLYVASNFEEESQSALSKQSFGDYELPDGSILSLGKEAFEIPERLFSDQGGLSHLVASCGSAGNEVAGGDMLSKVVVVGQGSGLTGLFSRFTKDITKEELFAGSDILHPENYKYATWIGGSILSSLSSFSPVTLDVYNEVGAAQVAQQLRERFIL